MDWAVKFTLTIIIPVCMIFTVSRLALKNWTAFERVLLSFFIVLCCYLLSLAVVSVVDMYVRIDPDILFLSTAGIILLSALLIKRKTHLKQNHRRIKLSHEIIGTVLILIYLGLALPFLRIPNVLGSDASHYASIAEKFVKDGRYQAPYMVGDRVAQHPIIVNWAIDRHPLVYMFISLWFWIFSTDIQILRIAFLTLGFLLIFFTSIILSRLFNSRLTWISTFLLITPSLLLSANMSLFFGGQELLSLTFSMAGFTLAVESSRIKWLGPVAGLALGLALAMWEPIAVPFIIVTLVILVKGSNIERRDLLFSYLAILMIFIAYYNKVVINTFNFYYSPLIVLISLSLILLLRAQNLKLFLLPLVITIFIIILRDYLLFQSLLRICVDIPIMRHIPSIPNPHELSPLFFNIYLVFDRTSAWFYYNIQLAPLSYTALLLVPISIINRKGRALALIFSLILLMISAFVGTYFTTGPSVYRFVLGPNYLFNMLAVMGLFSLKPYLSNVRKIRRIYLVMGNIRFPSSYILVFGLALLITMPVVVFSYIPSYKRALSLHESSTVRLVAYSETDKWLSSNFDQNEIIFSHAARVWTFYTNRTFFQPSSNIDPDDVRSEMISHRARFILFDSDTLYLRKPLYEKMLIHDFKTIYEHQEGFFVTILELIK